MYYPNWDTEYDNSGITPEPTPTDTLWREDSNILKPINSNAIVQMNRFGTNANKVISNIITSTDTQGILSDNQLMTAAKIQSLVNNTNTSPFEYVDSEKIPNHSNSNSGSVIYTNNIPSNTILNVNGPIMSSSEFLLDGTEYWSLNNGVYTKHLTTAQIQATNIGVNDSLSITNKLTIGDENNSITFDPTNDKAISIESANNTSYIIQGTDTNNVVIGHNTAYGYLQYKSNSSNTTYLRLSANDVVCNSKFTCNDLSATTLTLPSYDSTNNVVIEDIQTMPSENNVSIPSTNYVKNEISEEIANNTFFEKTDNNVSLKNGLSLNLTNANNTIQTLSSNDITCKTLTNNSILASDSITIGNDNKLIMLDSSANTMINITSPNAVYQSLGSDVNNKTTIGYAPQSQYGFIQSSFYDGTTQNISNIIFRSNSITLNKNTSIPSLTLNNVSVNTIQTSSSTDATSDTSIPTTKRVEEMISSITPSGGLVSGTYITFKGAAPSTYTDKLTYINSEFDWTRPIRLQMPQQSFVCMSMKNDGLHLLFATTYQPNRTNETGTFTDLFHSQEGDDLNPLTKYLTAENMRRIVCLSGNMALNLTSGGIRLIFDINQYGAYVEMNLNYTNKTYSVIVNCSNWPSDGNVDTHTFYELLISGIQWPISDVAKFEELYDGQPDINCKYLVK